MYRIFGSPTLSPQTIMYVRNEAKEQFPKFIPSTLETKHKGAVHHIAQAPSVVTATIDLEIRSMDTIFNGLPNFSTPRPKIPLSMTAQPDEKLLDRIQKNRKKSTKQLADAVLNSLIKEDAYLLLARKHHRNRASATQSPKENNPSKIPQLNPVFSYFVYYIEEGHLTKDPEINVMLAYLRKRHEERKNNPAHWANLLRNLTMLDIRTTYRRSLR